MLQALISKVKLHARKVKGLKPLALSMAALPLIRKIKADLTVRLMRMPLPSKRRLILPKLTGLSLMVRPMLIGAIARLALLASLRAQIQLWNSLAGVLT